MLNTLGIAYEEVRIDQDKDALKYIKSLGYTTAPVVITEADFGDGATFYDSWGGFKPSRIEALHALIEDVAA
jgi:glutaredoxin